MKNCTRCGTACQDQATFCNRCGSTFKPKETASTPQSVKCPRCGSGWKTGTAFCGRCGSSFTGRPPVQPKPAVCSHCGAPVIPGHTTCFTCVNAQPLSPVCVRCRRPVRSGASYCGACGSNLPVTPSYAPSPSNTMILLKDPSLIEERNRPATLEGLNSWFYKACPSGLPNPRSLGFCLGRKNALPGCYFIDRHSGRVIFGRLEIDRTVTTFYEGTEEAYAVSGFWHTMLERTGLWNPVYE